MAEPQDDTFQDATKVKIAPEPTKDSKRLSLGSLVGKGLVTGARAFWETNNGKQVYGSKGTLKANRLPNPLAQSQDRGLLFSVSLPSRNDSASLEQQASIGSSSSLQPASSGGALADGQHNEPSSAGKANTPPSGLKKMWRSMTGRTPKSGQKADAAAEIGAVSAGGASVDDVVDDQGVRQASLSVDSTLDAALPSLMERMESIEDAAATSDAPAANVSSELLEATQEAPLTHSIEAEACLPLQAHAASRAHEADMQDAADITTSSRDVEEEEKEDEEAAAEVPASPANSEHHLADVGAAELDQSADEQAQLLEVVPVAAPRAAAITADGPMDADGAHWSADEADATAAACTTPVAEDEVTAAHVHEASSGLHVQEASAPVSPVFALPASHQPAGAQAAHSTSQAAAEQEAVDTDVDMEEHVAGIAAALSAVSEPAAEGGAGGGDEDESELLHSPSHSPNAEPLASYPLTFNPSMEIAPSQAESNQLLEQFNAATAAEPSAGMGAVQVSTEVVCTSSATAHEAHVSDSAEAVQQAEVEEGEAVAADAVEPAVVEAEAHAEEEGEADILDAMASAEEVAAGALVFEAPFEDTAEVQEAVPVAQDVAVHVEQVEEAVVEPAQPEVIAPVAQAQEVFEAEMVEAEVAEGVFEAEEAAEQAHAEEQCEATIAEDPSLVELQKAAGSLGVVEGPFYADTDAFAAADVEDVAADVQEAVPEVPAELEHPAVEPHSPVQQPTLDLEDFEMEDVPVAEQSTTPAAIRMSKHLFMDPMKLSMDPASAECLARELDAALGMADEDALPASLGPTPIALGSPVEGLGALPSPAPMRTPAGSLGLLDIEMEDATLQLDAGLGMPVLQETPSPVASHPNSAQRAMAGTAGVRDSLPLFVNASYNISDSMALNRESLSNIEPFGRGLNSGTAAAVTGIPAASTRPAEFMASVMTLGTLHEEGSFADDLPVKPTAALHVGTVTPKSAAKAAARHKHAAVSAGFGDEHLSDLPNDLPDPTFAVTRTPLPAAAPSSHAAVSNSPAVAEPSSKQPVSARSRGVYSATKSKAAPGSAAKKEAAMSTPLSRLAADASTTPRTGGKPIVSTVKKMMGTPSNPNPTLNRPGTSLPSAGKPAPRLSGPGSAAKGPVLLTPAAGTKVPATPASVATPTLMPAAAAQPQQAQMPNLPISWNTPLAQMQQLPMDFAKNAPLLDMSPFTLDMDFNMDTTNIAEEAKRLMQTLAGSQPTPQPAAGSSAGSTPLNLLSGAHGGTPSAGIAMASFNPSPMPPGTAMLRTSIKGLPPVATPLGSNGMSAGAGSSLGTEGSMSPSFSSINDLRQAEMLKALTNAVNRAKAAEQKVEELEDQIKTMSFGGDMLGESDAGEMEREARIAAEEQLHTTNMQLQTVQANVRVLQQSLVASQQEAADSKAQLQAKDAALTTTQSQLQAAMAQISQLKSALAEEQTKAADTKAKYTAEMTKIKSGADKMKEELSKAVKEIVTHQIKNSETMGEVAQWQKRCEEYKQAHKLAAEAALAADLKVNEYKAKVDDLLSRNAQVVGLFNEACTMSEANERELKELRQKLREEKGAPGGRR